MSEKKHVELAVADYARRAGVAASDVEVLGVSKQQIPNPPLKPGEVSIGLVVYRYFIEVGAGGRSTTYVGERGKVRPA